VKVTGLMEPDDLKRWAEGVELEDGRTQAAEVRFLRHEEGKTRFEITIFEGRNQQIRRMGETTGFPVMRLARVSFGGVTHDGIRPGQWRFLTVDELTDLKKEFGVPRRVRSADTGGRTEKVFGKVQPRGEARGGRGAQAKARARTEPGAEAATRPRGPRERDARPRTHAPVPDDGPSPRAARPRAPARDEAPRARGPRDPRAQAQPREEAPRARGPRDPRAQAQPREEAPRASGPRDPRARPQGQARDEAPNPRARAARPFPSKKRG